mmetsp:Transcript_7487/g.9751  ORF Transcript_7487/g.9751 Transcript_7487/m.9751 type:complete len:102 (+) Transcript_7487:43-348(+)
MAVRRFSWQHPPVTFSEGDLSKSPSPDLDVADVALLLFLPLDLILREMLPLVDADPSIAFNNETQRDCPRSRRARYRGRRYTSKFGSPCERHESCDITTMG